MFLFEDESRRHGADVQRVQVWDALSEFFLDTFHTEEELERLAKRIVATTFSIDELRHIAIYEVTPICFSNLFCLPGGVWAGFSPDWLIPRCLEQQMKYPFQPDKMYFRFEGLLYARFGTDCLGAIDRVDRIRKSESQI